MKWRCFCISLIIICGVMVLLPRLTHAQDSTTVEEQLERAFEELDTEETGLEGEQLTQFLEDLAQNPVNINSAGLDDLLQVPGINLKTARAILEYRANKPFERKQELLEVSGIGNVTYQRMHPFVTIGGTGSHFRNMYTQPGYWLAGPNVEVFSRYQRNLEEAEGYIRPDSAGGYVGNPGKYYQRFRYYTNHISVNFTQEKDAGETLDGINGFDYNSGHIALEDNGKLNELVIGDYSLSFGQGLVLWSGGAFGKGREVIGSISKNERGIKPYTSAQETDFFRGMAASYGDQIQLTAFYSTRPRTASVINGDTTRFPSSNGFHRTQNEISRKNNIDQTVVGGRVRFDTPIGLFAFTGYHNKFSSYITKGSSVSNKYDFEGKENSVFGIDYRGLVGNALLFSELGRSQNGGYGVIGGIESSVGENTELAMSYRNYSKDFQSFLGNGFGETSSAPQNQEGFYVGLRHDLTQKMVMSVYFDQYKFSSPRFGTTQATGGYDMLGLVEMRFTRQLSLYVLLRNEIQDQEYEIINQQGKAELKLGSEQKHSIRTNFEYWVSEKVRLRTRVEMVRNLEAGENWESGFLVYQDLRIQPINALRIDGRITIFDTESFNTRLYQFESDLLYVMSNTALFDRGQRAYITIKYEATDFLDALFKYGITMFEDTETISSGLNEISGNTRSNIGLQVRIKF